MNWYENSEPIFYEPSHKPERGDILAVPRKNGAYTHYGIYVGNNRVVHFSGPVGDDIGGVNTRIRKTLLKDFARGDTFYVQVINEKKRKFSPFEVIKRANSCVGLDEVVGGKYNFMLNNCEHFATWCVYGVGMSHQIHKIGKKAVNAQLEITETIVNVAKSIKQFAFNRRIKKEKEKAEKEAEKVVKIETK